MAETSDPPDARPTLTVTDLVAGVPLVVVAVVATASLALAHAHRHSLVSVLVSSVLVLGLLGAVLLRLGGRPRVVGDRWGLAAVLGAGALAAVMFLPGFSYGVSDKDPGGYVAHSVEIARGGSYSFTDPALAAGELPVAVEGPGARLAGVWIRNEATGLIVPQFYHLWPALLATSYDLAGYGGITTTTPIVGVIAAMALVALLRRVGGVSAAVIGALLLATNMLQVWQAKYPTTEMLAQMLFVGTVLGVVVAVQERWGPAGFLAGALVGVGFLNRADGWLLLMLSAGTIAALYVTRRADRLTTWALGGLAVLAPYAMWQAYAAAYPYTRSNNVPGLRKTLLLLGVLAVATVVVRLALRRVVDFVLALGARDRVQRLAGLAVCAGALALMVVGFLRPRLFGLDYFTFGGRRYRSYDEQIMRRLSWFFTLPGFAVAGLGVAVVALRRWRVAAWAVVLPTLVLFPIFAYHSRNSSRLMWWARRYASNVLPGMVVLMALALAFALAWQWRGRRPLRAPAVLATIALVGVFLSQSLPVRRHDEWHGSFGVSERISRLAGDARGVFLFQRSPYCCASPTSLWAGPVWLERGELAVLMPSAPEQQAAYVRAYRAAFPSDPLFVVWTTGAALPDSLRGLGLVEVDHVKGTLPFWEESDTHRPRKPRQIAYEFVVFRLP